MPASQSTLLSTCITGPARTDALSAAVSEVSVVVNVANLAVVAVAVVVVVVGEAP